MRESRQKFVRLAENRTRRTLKDISLIGNLSNRSHYTWSKNDVDEIFLAIESAIRSARKRFAQADNQGESVDFSLSRGDSD